jgi:hypothetical protein
MDAFLTFLLSASGFVLGGFVVIFAVGCYIVASRARKINETT